MSHFLNREWLAPNVLTAAVDPAVVGEFAAVGATDPGFATVSPEWQSDIAWVSAANEDRFALFESAFDRLALAAHVEPYLDLDRAIRLYCGFLVIRSRCKEPDFPVDWVKTGNQAFTAMTPVSRTASGFGLLYEKLTGEIGDYDYKPGEAVVFGDNFRHSTKPGSSSAPVVLLCFEFGTDKMDYWDRIRRTVGHQTGLLRRPDGEFTRSAGGPSPGY
jgi:hypothetical protein